MTRLVLVGADLRFLVVAWSPAQGRYALEITMEVLQHMDEFVADQLAAHLSSHRPLLEADGAQAAVFCPAGCVFAGELGWDRDHLNPEALAFAQELFADGRIGATGAARTLRGQGVVRPSCGLDAARKKET